MRPGGPRLASAASIRYTGTMTSVSQRRHRPPRPALTPRQAVRRRARLDRLLDPEVLKALAEPTRARLLSCLLKCGRPCSVTEVAACCSTDFSVVARHLALMARAGLLTAEKQGRTVWYAADGSALAARFRDLAEAIDELTPAAHSTGPDDGPACCGDAAEGDCCPPGGSP